MTWFDFNSLALKLKRPLNHSGSPAIWSPRAYQTSTQVEAITACVTTPTTVDCSREVLKASLWTFYRQCTHDRAGHQAARNGPRMGCWWSRVDSAENPMNWLVALRSFRTKGRLVVSLLFNFILHVSFFRIVGFSFLLFFVYTPFSCDISGYSSSVFVTGLHLNKYDDDFSNGANLSWLRVWSFPIQVVTFYLYSVPCLLHLWFFDITSSSLFPSSQT